MSHQAHIMAQKGNFMGLFYIMPVSHEEGDRVEVRPLATDKQAKQLVLKSYGPPMIFWFYLMAIVSAMFFLFLAIYDPMMKMMAGTDTINRWLAFTVFALFIVLFISLLCFYFYEKRLIKLQDKLEIEHRLFGVKVWKSIYELKGVGTFKTEHFLEGATVARQSNDASLRAFHNQGHFHLFAELKNSNKILIDRHSRRADLEKMAQFLAQY